MSAALHMVQHAAHLLSALALAGAPNAHAAPPCTVELWDGSGRVEGFLVGEGPEGISVRARDEETAPTVALRWDQVESIATPAESSERSERLALGAALWRGRTRVMRGDLAGARVEFAKALAAAPDEARVLRALAQEGLARTAEADPSSPDSLIAALSTAASRATQPLPREWIGGGDPVDAQTGLLLGVLPAFRDGVRAQAAQVALERAAREATDSGDRVAASLLFAAARIAAADSGITVAPRAGGDPQPTASEGNAASGDARARGKRAVRLMEAWADAVATDPTARKRGRTTLNTLLRTLEGASRAVALYAIGRGQCMESDPDIVRQGAARMLIVAAAYEAEAPHLAAAAQAQAAIALARIGDEESAAVLRALDDSPSTSTTTSRPAGQGAIP